MVRPRQFDPVVVEEALLGVFWSRGSARTSIEHLTEATGLLRGSLYAAYGDKENMFRTAVKLYVADLAAQLATEKVGLDGVQHALDTVVRLTARDPKRRGCLILNAIPESRALSEETKEILQSGLKAMQALLRSRLRAAHDDSDADIDLDPLVAIVFAASVSIRVLGRAGQSRRLLENIAKGAIDAARCRFDTAEE